jgi:ubiquinol-cytochrome c reductase cytochrome b subunit
MHTEQEQPTQTSFWENRTGWSPLKQFLFLEPLPGGARWTAAFGSLLLFAFVLQVVTGILLATNYSPSVESAWASVAFIQKEVPLGAFVRGMHHWGSSAMVICLLVHLVQVFVWGAYKKPRELTWMVGVLLLLCTLGLAFTGYLLPWDQKAFWATKVGLGIASTVPLIGDDLRTLLQGGPEMGNLTLTRFFALHAFVLPGLLILLVVVHLYLFRLHGVTPPWWVSADQLRAQEEPFWPKQAFKDGVFALAFLVGLGLWCYFRPVLGAPLPASEGHYVFQVQLADATLGLFHQQYPAPLEEQANPAKPYEARPEWYFMFLFQLLRYFKGPYEVVGTFVLPTLFFLVLFFWPFLDRSPYRNPARRPLAMTLLGAGTIGLVGLTIFAIATDVRMQEPAVAQAKAAPPANPAGPLQLADVAKVYNSNCAACHGIEGSGKQLRAGLPTIPDFTSLAWQMSQTDLEITHRIQEGNEPLMPAYRDKLNQPQILALAVYVRAFAVPPTQAALPKPVEPTPSQTAHMPPALVYRAYCLACHDANGRGTTVRQAMPEIPDFGDAKWQTARTDAELTHSILEGKGKFMLPMKDKLGPVDAEHMVAYIRGAFKGGKPVAELEPPQRPVPPPPVEPVIVPGPKADVTPVPPATPSAAMAARTRLATGLYRQYCLVCHGTNGTGVEMRASMPNIPDFTGRAWQESRSNPQLAVSILEGKDKLMPAFRGRISDDQVPDLVAFVRAFGPRQPPAAELSQGPPSDFEERFRKLQEEWNELHKQLENLSPPPRKP